MFRLTYRDRKSDSTVGSTVEYFDDIKSLGQALINIVDNEKEEQSAMNWCGRAHWGDKVVRYQFGYKIECFNEEELKRQVQAVANEISEHCGIVNNFIGWDNNALTWDFNLDLTYMKYHDNYGYCMIINCYDGSTTKEVWNFTSKDKKKFIEECIKALSKYKSNQSDKTSGHGCRFIIGQKYMGVCNKTRQNISIIITKKTTQFVYYETNTGIIGKAMIKHMGGHEAILIKKVGNLLVVSTDKLA